MKKVLLLGSGELGKELVISLKRLGCNVRACDSYDNAPAQQVTDSRRVINMLDGDQVLREINEYQPDLIVPEIEAIRTEALIEAEEKGYTVIPSARAVNLTMNRDHIRDRAYELGLKTARFQYAESLNELIQVSKEVGFPFVIKPVMSSSGKGQSLVTENNDIEDAQLFVKEIRVDSAGMLKRLRPAPQGRAHRIRKRSNHVTLVLGSKNLIES